MQQNKIPAIKPASNVVAFPSGAQAGTDEVSVGTERPFDPDENIRRVKLMQALGAVGFAVVDLARALAREMDECPGFGSEAVDFDKGEHEVGTEAGDCFEDHMARAEMFLRYALEAAEARRERGPLIVL